jgi:hypothetical protein
MSEKSGHPAGPQGELTESQFLALWGGLPPPLLRLIDLYLLDNTDVPAPHLGMDVERFCPPCRPPRPWPPPGRKPS